jgi:transcriptional regulator with XRE-family HTH domain
MNCLSLFIFVLHTIINDIPMSKLSYNRIKEWLVRKDKTSRELADYLEVKEQTVSNWCTNFVQPDMETLYEISNFLEIEAIDLLSLKKDLKQVKRRRTS